MIRDKTGGIGLAAMAGLIFAFGREGTSRVVAAMVNFRT